MTGALGSLTGRLLLVAGLFSFVLLLIAGFGSAELYRSTVMRDVNDRLDGDLRIMIDTVSLGDEAGSLRGPPDPRYSQTFSGRYWMAFVEDSNGWTELDKSKSLYDETLSLSADDVGSIVNARGASVSVAGRAPTDEPLHMRARAITIADNPRTLLFLVAVNQRPINQDVRGFAAAVAAFVLALALALIATVFFQVRWGLAPLNRLRSEIEKVEQGERSSLSDAVPQEVKPLADALNSLVASSRDSVKRARDRAGNLAHGLKTPLAVMRNASADEPDAQRKQLFEDQLSSMTSIIERHLRTARASATARMTDERCDLRATLARLTKTLQRMYPESEILIETRNLVGSVRVAQHDLDDILGNILDNGMKWANQRLQITAQEDPRRWTLMIDDDGPGLDANARQAMLQRGRRLDEETVGSGLGLAIVKELIEAYDGQLSLDESPLGGLRVLITLPRAGKLAKR